MKTWVLLALLTVSGGRCAEESPQDEPAPLQDAKGQLISSVQAVMDQFTAKLQTLEAKVTANLQTLEAKVTANQRTLEAKFTANQRTLEAKVATNQRTLEAIAANQRNLEASVGDISNVLDALKLQVGFSVRIKKNMELVGQGLKVKFSLIHYNQGEAYSPTTGDFTAPVAGMYSFSLKTESGLNEAVKLHMMKEGLPVLYLYGYDPDSHLTPSGDVVLHLDRGQRVWVETVSDAKHYVRGYTRFGGFLVKPDV